jgi:signal peptidase II
MMATLSLPSLARRFETWLILAIVVLDQVTKALVVRGIALHDRVTIVPGLLNLTHVRNTGAAFGMMNSVHFPGKTVVITVLAVTAILAIGVYARRFASETRLARTGLGLVLGGAAGNLLDRARMGYVVDFVDAHYAGWHFWAFNVADSAITVGAIVLILDMFRAPSHVPEAA